MSWLLRSMRAWTHAQKHWAVVLCLVTMLPAALTVGSGLGYVFEHADTLHYMAMAEGKPAMLPFASRQLGPLLVRALMHAGHVPVDTAFLFEGIAALGLLVGATMFLVVESGAPRWVLIAVAGMFLWAELFNGLVLPDLLYDALVSGMLLLLWRRQWILAAMMLLPLAVARESTVLTAACFVAAGWGRLRPRVLWTAVVSTAAGLGVVSWLTRDALPNQERISPVFYMAAKMPWNFLKNFLGLGVWANVYPACAAPRWVLAMHLGPLHGVGWCGFLPQSPLRLAGYALSSFGLLPLLLVWVWRRRARGGEHAVLLRFCLVYGLISYFAAGLLGDALQRLFLYGWPAFLVGLPMLLGAGRGNFRGAGWAAGLIALHVAMSWGGFGVKPGALLVRGLLIYGAGWALLRQGWREEGDPAMERSSFASVPML